MGEGLVLHPHGHALPSPVVLLQGLTKYTPSHPSQISSSLYIIAVVAADVYELQGKAQVMLQEVYV